MAEFDGTYPIVTAPPGGGSASKPRTLIRTVVDETALRDVIPPG